MYNILWKTIFVNCSQNDSTIFRSSGFKKYDERISLELDENGDTWMINLGFGNQHHLTIDTNTNETKIFDSLSCVEKCMSPISFELANDIVNDVARKFLLT